MRIEPDPQWGLTLLKNGVFVMKFCEGYACGHVLLVCEEVGSVFSSDLSSLLGTVDDAATVCPSCRRIAVSRFRNSTVEEVQQLGFQPGEYE